MGASAPINENEKDPSFLKKVRLIDLRLLKN
jgi:hypothetical protein